MAMEQREIRSLDAGSFDHFVALTLRAYPRFGMPFEKRGIGFEEGLRRQFDDPTIEPVGFFVDGTLAGVMRIFHFEMNFFGSVVPVRGLGSLAVDLPFKKRHLARDMIRHFHRTAQGDGCFLTALYPFDPPFYRKMGYGYGTRLDRYHIRLSSLPGEPDGGRVDYLGNGVLGPLRECYHRVFRGTHGLFDRSTKQMEPLLGDGARKLLVGVRAEGKEKIAGYAAFHFVRGYPDSLDSDNLYRNDIFVDEMVYETPMALRELLGFFRRQADQAGRLILRTQDPAFYHLLDDPGDSSGNVVEPAYHQSAVSGVGLMYRLIDLPRGLDAYFAARPKEAKTAPAITLSVTDSFIPENAGDHVIGSWKTGKAAFPGARLALDVSALSSLVMGAVGLRELVALGLAEPSDPSTLPAAEGLFSGAPRPVCYTGF